MTSTPDTATDTHETETALDAPETPEPTAGHQNPDPARKTPQDADSGPDGAPEPDTTEPEPNPAAEAAKWRRRLRAAEKTATELKSDLDAAHEQITALRRHAVEQALTPHGLTPEALWATVDLDDVLDDDHLPDPRKISQAVTVARQQLGISLRVDPDRLKSGATAPDEHRNTGWTTAFAPSPR